MRTPKATTRVKILRFVCVPLCLVGIAIGVTNDSPIAVISGVLGIAFAVLSTRMAKQPNPTDKTKRRKMV